MDIISKIKKDLELVQLMADSFMKEIQIAKDVIGERGPREGRGKPLILQRVIISKKIASNRAQAKKTAMKFADKFLKVDETEESWIFRVREPSRFSPRTFRSVRPQKGVTLTLGKFKS